MPRSVIITPPGVNESNVAMVTNGESLQDVIASATAYKTVIVDPGHFSQNIFIPAGYQVNGSGITSIIDGDIFIEAGGQINEVQVKDGKRVIHTDATTPVSVAAELVYNNHFHAAEHGLEANDPIVFSKSFGNITAGTVYYVLGGATLFSNYFQVKTLIGGTTAIELTPHTNAFVEVVTTSLNDVSGDQMIESMLDSLSLTTRITLADNVVVISSIETAGDLNIRLGKAVSGERVVYEGLSITGDIVIPEGVILYAKFQGAEINGDVTVSVGSRLIGFKIAAGYTLSGAGWEKLSAIRVGSSNAAMFTDINQAIAVACSGATIYLETGTYLIHATSRTALNAIVGDLTFVGSGATSNPTTNYTTIEFEEAPVSDRFSLPYGTAMDYFAWGAMKFFNLRLINAAGVIVFRKVYAVDCSFSMDTVYCGEFSASDTSRVLSINIVFLLSAHSVISLNGDLPTSVNIQGFNIVNVNYITASIVVIRNNDLVTITAITTDSGLANDYAEKHCSLMITGNRELFNPLSIGADFLNNLPCGTSELLVLVLSNGYNSGKIDVHLVDGILAPTYSTVKLKHDMEDGTGTYSEGITVVHLLADTRTTIALVANEVNMAKADWSKVGLNWQKTFTHDQADVNKLYLNGGDSYGYVKLSFASPVVPTDNELLNSLLKVDFVNNLLKIPHSTYVDLLFSDHIADDEGSCGTLYYVTLGGA